MNKEQIQRFQIRIKMDLSSGCWKWLGTMSAAGYGTFSIGGKNTYAHRVSYELHEGKIPDGLQIDHLCRNRRCVNPAHLDVVTTQENTRRGLLGKINNWKSKNTHCPSGHPYSGKNLRITKQGWRHCIICGLIHQKTLYYKRKKELQH